MHGPIKPALRYRSIWISDVHLGTRRAQTMLFLDFLQRTESSYLYIVGDLIDNWALSRAWYWDQSHNDVIQKLLRKARRGTRVIYIPGNHDEYFRDFATLRFGRIAVATEILHVTADGKRYLIMHGDRFDAIVRYAKWLAFVGDRGYQLALTLNTGVNRVRAALGWPYWSLSAAIKHKVKRAVEFISLFEQAIVREARRRGAHGVICGHIHTPQIRDIEGIHYCNDGDWVESCSALVEHFDGRLELLRWADVDARSTGKIYANRDRLRRLAPAG
jgi:UDP-2,3-diacylglucosamine pyrophosphatase LpxH